MNIYTYYAEAIGGIIAELKLVDVPPVVHCESPRNPAHGDLATNIAMVLAKPMGKPPMEIAKMLAMRIEELEGVEDCKIAQPGFINLRLAPSVWQDRLNDILKIGRRWGASDIGAGKRVNVEFVSANPTGPLHAAHARGAVIGDTLANILQFCGYKVTREYYVNDAGGQIDALVRSVSVRYRQQLGDATAKLGKDDYQGEYLIDVAKGLEMEFGDSLLTKEIDEQKDYIRYGALSDAMYNIVNDLRQLRVRMDEYVHETEFVEKKRVEETVNALEQGGMLYRAVPEKPKSGNLGEWQAREQLLFATTRFGDDQDRALTKADGSWTYFANDIAYHRHKLERGYDILINVWGADHAGYVKRMQAAVATLNDADGDGKGDKTDFHIILVQLVKLMEKGEPVKMSKRAGNFVALADMLKEVKSDVIRFTMLTRRHDQHLDFDYAKVKEQSKENPVFYLQYAYARASSALDKPEARIADEIANPDFSLLTDPAELALIKQLASFPRVVATAAKHYEPHRIAFALGEIAADFHALWQKGRMHDPSLRFISDDAELTAARLKLVESMTIVVRNGLRLLGIDSPEDL